MKKAMVFIGIIVTGIVTILAAIAAMYYVNFRFTGMTVVLQQHDIMTLAIGSTAGIIAMVVVEKINNLC